MNTVKSLKSTIKRKIITSILTISLVLGSFSLAFAYPTTADTMADALGTGWNYTNGLGAPYGKDMSQSWYYIFGKNNLAYLRDLRYQLTGNDYDTHSGTSIYTMINNINQSLNNPSSSIYSLLLQQANKIDQINSTLGTGSSLSNVLTKLDAVVNWTSSTNTGINTLVNNGVSVDGIEELVSNTAIWTTPTYYPFTYSYRTAINSNPAFYSSNTNGLNIGIRADETTGALKFATQTINNQSDYLSLMHNDLMQLSMRMQTMGATYNPVVYDPDGNAYSYNSQSIMDALVTYGNNHGKILTDIRSSSQSIDRFLRSRFSIQSSTPYYYNSRSSVRNSFTSNTIGGSTNGNQVSYFSSSWAGGRFITSGSADNQSIFDLLKAVNYNLLSVNGGLFTPGTNYLARVANNDLSGQGTLVSFGSIADYMSELFTDVDYMSKRLVYMFADDDTIQAKQANSSQAQAVLTGFTGSGQASATANDYGTLSTGVSDVKGGMNTNVSASNAFSIFNNSNGYSFWSAETLQELNQSGTATRSFSKSVNDNGYEYYNNRLEYLHNVMNGGEKK